MKVSKFLSITNKVDSKEATLTISGDIGYNVWADTYEDYKKNTSEAMAAELQAIKDLKAEVINLEIESLGGDVFHGLAIYSLLKQSGARIKTYYRGVNASMSTVIGSVSNKEDIFMDSTGLYLVHKPMTFSQGNANDLQETINSLDKTQEALERAYLDLGVNKSDLDELMERNGGHGEWLTFEEAKQYGFVGNEWTTEKVTNYAKLDFSNRKILVPNKLINKSKTETMQIEEKDKKSLFQEFKNWFKNEKEAEEKANELETLKAENESLKAQLEEATKEVVEEVQEVEETQEVEPTMEEIVNAKVAEAIKNIATPATETKVSNKKRTEPLSNWEVQLEKHKFLNNKK